MGIEMARLKNVEQLEKVVTDFVSQFGCTAEFGSDFSYYYDLDKVQFSLLMGDVDDRTFMEFVEKNFPGVNCNIFIWSLLHEVGHHMTKDLWTDEEQEQFDEDKDHLRNLSECEEFLDEENWAGICHMYYEILDERVATAWAADYIYFHEKELKEFWRSWLEVLWDFCVANDFDEGLKAF